MTWEAKYDQPNPRGQVDELLKHRSCSDVRKQRFLKLPGDACPGPRQFGARDVKCGRTACTISAGQMLRPQSNTVVTLVCRRCAEAILFGNRRETGVNGNFAAECEQSSRGTAGSSK